MDDGDAGSCSRRALHEFSKTVKGQMLRVNVLLVVNAILAAVMVGIGGYGHRYRHRRLTGFLFQSATGLFLPIVSYIVSSIDNHYAITVFTGHNEIIPAQCDTDIHFFIVMIWTALVQIAGINTFATVARDAREGPSVSPPLVSPLVQAIWTLCLASVAIIRINFRAYNEDPAGYLSRYLEIEIMFDGASLVLFAPFGIIFAKLCYKNIGWYIARKSIGLGRNPPLIVGYMEQLQVAGDHTELTTGEHIHMPPPLIVMGEDTVPKEMQPHGYNYKWTMPPNRVDWFRRKNIDGLVTIDRIWQLNDMFIQRSTPQIKDICMSYALFKLLRCRFARYTTVEAGFRKASNFLWQILLEDCDDERILGMISYELSFLHDYYYSSFPALYSTGFPFLSIFISVLSIGNCLLLIIVATAMLLSSELRNLTHLLNQQMVCEVQCISKYQNIHQITGTDELHFGSMYFDFVMLLSLVALVLLVEVREIASYIYSNWRKVALVCLYVNNAQGCISRKLKKQCEMLNHWKGKMNQCTILVLHPRKRSIANFRRLLAMPDQNIEVPRVVKAGILHALRSYDEPSRSNGVVPLPSSLQVNNNLLWDFSGAKGMVHTMLVCHIATSILEVRVRSEPSQPLIDHKIAATCLSRYCAYLVAYCPELLPDDDDWCKSLYKAVKKDVAHVQVSNIAASTPEEEYQQLVDLLGTRSKHEVLKNGVELGKRLAELTEGEEAAWRVMAGFWSEVILYVAPSDNLDGHSVAIARGGELITHLWALLAHLGIDYQADNTGVV